MSATNPKTRGISASEIRPCDNCGGPLAPMFREIQVRMALFNRRNVQSFMGTAQILGGSAQAARIAEVLTPGGDALAEVLEEPECVQTIYLCNDCYSGIDRQGKLRRADLAELCEKRAEAGKKL